jgi:hypothetical protein
MALGLDEATTRALAGDATELYALLSRSSGLPGERANLSLASAFAESCASDARAAVLATKMAKLEADAAPGGSPLEFIPLCGVLAAGSIAARQPKARSAMLEIIHDACDDLRFRVRDVVPEALAKIGAREGEALLADLETFTEGYFHAAALLRAMTSQAWLPQIADAEPAVRVLVRAFELADSAPSSAERWPGYKALVEMLESSIAPLALRFGEPVFAAAAGFARTDDPHLRDSIKKALSRDKKLRARYPSELASAMGALDAATKAPRDPRSLPRPTRKRGGGRRRQ